MGEQLSVRDVVRLTGVTERTLAYYDKKGILTVARTGERVANNRKLYTWNDIDRLKEILILKEYGFELDEIKDVLQDSAFDLETAIRGKMRELTRQANRLRDGFCQNRCLLGSLEAKFEKTVDSASSSSGKTRRASFQCRAKRPNRHLFWQKLETAQGRKRRRGARNAFFGMPEGGGIPGEGRNAGERPERRGNAGERPERRGNAGMLLEGRSAGRVLGCRNA